MILFFCLVLIGCVLEIKTSSDSHLPTDQLLNDVLNGLEEINVIPLLNGVEDDQMQYFEELIGELLATVPRIRGAVYRFRCSPNFVIEDELITNQFLDDISLLYAQFQDDQLLQLIPERAIDDLETLREKCDDLDIYVRSVLRQYAAEDRLDAIYFRKLITSIYSREEGTSQDLSFRNDDELIRSQRSKLDDLVLDVRSITRELEKFKERDVDDVRRRNELDNDIRKILDNLRIKIQGGRLSIQQRLEILYSLELRYQALYSHLQDMLRMYEQRMLDRRLNEVLEFMRRVEDLVDRLNDIEDRNPLEMQRTDQLVDEMNEVLPPILNKAENRDLTYVTRIVNMKILEENFQSLECYVQRILKLYQSKQKKNSEKQTSQQDCPNNQL